MNLRAYRAGLEFLPGHVLGSIPQHDTNFEAEVFAHQRTDRDQAYAWSMVGYGLIDVR